MFERFSRDARLVVTEAEGLAQRSGDSVIRAAHLLWALSNAGSPAADVLAAHGVTPDGVATAIGQTAPDAVDASALSSIGIDLGTVRSAVEETFGVGALDGPDLAHGMRRGARVSRPRFTEGARGALTAAVRATLKTRSREITSALLLVGVLRSEDTQVYSVLGSLGVDRAGLLDEAENQASQTT